MKIILFPDKQIISTYLQIGCEVELIVSWDGEQVILCPDNSLEQLELYLKENQLSPINKSYDYFLFISKDYAQWNYHCPKYYSSLSSRMQQHQAYYQDGMSTITKVFSQLHFLADIRLKKSDDEEIVSMITYLQNLS
ncbi:hypothetical protein RBG61_08030 [Paludicola sp. MB14-C6]|uniref:hypothetical protein n=1 Tax=Paludihabitans sp. MB14-C6 TaxID=3070656 RepID=UPI0027DE2793|nr:hypothetical protein [Paludicola sp. MB14-C6]WMJ21946.1 hypothetical protein RBG61_08030 [Paludicola sp. MB14-C6]